MFNNISQRVLVLAATVLAFDAGFCLDNLGATQQTGGYIQLAAGNSTVSKIQSEIDNLDAHYGMTVRFINQTYGEIESLNRLLRESNGDQILVDGQNVSRKVLETSVANFQTRANELQQRLDHLNQQINERLATLQSLVQQAH